jgi:hypothetical protein
MMVFNNIGNQTFKVGESKDYLLNHIIQEVGINW